MSDAMLALESLTPGGSEFVGDVDRCIANIRDRFARDHRWVMKSILERNAAREEKRHLCAALSKIIELLEDREVSEAHSLAVQTMDEEASR